jgi:hypothetical protein
MFVPSLQVVTVPIALEAVLLEELLLKLKDPPT